MENTDLPGELKRCILDYFNTNLVCFDFNHYLIYVKIKDNKNIGLNLDYRNNDVKYYSTEKSKYQTKVLSKTYAKQIFKSLYNINKEQTLKILELYNLTELDLENIEDYEIHKTRVKKEKIYKQELKNVVKEVKKLNSINKKKEIHNRVKEKTKHINSKDNKTKREDIFNFSPGFNCIAEAFGVKTNFDDNIEINNKETEYFIPLKNKSTKKTKRQIDSLVIWDIENINFHNDFSIITRYIKKENQIKIVSFSKSYKNYCTDIDFKLRKLKKRNWIINEVKNAENSADEELIENYFKYTGRNTKIKEVIIISSDSDFSSILEDAKIKNIKSTVIYREINQKKRWFMNANEIIEINKLK